MDKEDIYQKFKAIGMALLKMDLENSHSGNISLKFIDKDGNEKIAITSTGSQKGDLERENICYLEPNRTTYGHYKATSESDIHMAVLSMQGVYSLIHGHTKYATIETLDDKERPPLTQPNPLLPIDSLGYFHLNGEVPVHWYSVPCGSPEMVKKIPEILRNHNATIVQGHGTFAKGSSVEEALFYLSLVENSGYIQKLCRSLKVNVEKIQEGIRANPRKYFNYKPTPYHFWEKVKKKRKIKNNQQTNSTFQIPNSSSINGKQLNSDYNIQLSMKDYQLKLICDFSDERDTIKEFLKTGKRIFESKISPFHTGSISLRCVNTMLYAPWASMPQGLPSPLLELNLSEEKDDDLITLIHKKIYKHTTFQCVIHTYIPEAEACSYYIYPKSSSLCDYIVPIDGEGSFLYLKIPVLPYDADIDLLIKNLTEYNVVVVRGGGVWSAGEQSMSEALHHPSSLKDICFYRIEAISKGLDIRKLEPQKARYW